MMEMDVVSLYDKPLNRSVVDVVVIAIAWESDLSPVETLVLLAIGTKMDCYNDRTVLLPPDIAFLCRKSEAVIVASLKSLERKCFLKLDIFNGKIIDIWTGEIIRHRTRIEEGILRDRIQKDRDMKAARKQLAASRKAARAAQ